MTNRNLTYRFSAWGLSALVLVTAGGLLTRKSIAQESPVYITGADVPPAYLSPNVGQTVNQMWQIYGILKANEWKSSAVPFDLTTYPDQQLSEKPHRRAAQMGGFFFPNLALYDDVAIWTDTYYRENLVVYPTHATSDPQGFFLVMFKSGQLVKVAPRDVRMYPHPTIPDGMVPVFPGMKVYRADLPMLPNYQ